MSSVSETTTIAANQSAIIASKNDTVTGSASSNLTQSQFLTLLTQQLQYQDPMDPTSNSEMISQVNSFSQLNAQTDMSSTLSATQAASYIGKTVTVTDPTDSTKTISGSVTSATLNGTNSAIEVNGTYYPIKYLKSVSATATTTETTAASS